MFYLLSIYTGDQLQIIIFIKNCEASFKTGTTSLQTANGG